MNKPKPIEKKKVRSNFTLDREAYEKLKHWSETTGIPMSQILERIINEGLTDERLNALRTAITALELDPITSTSGNRQEVNEPEPENRPLGAPEQRHIFNIEKRVTDNLMAKGMQMIPAMEKAHAWVTKAYKEGRLQL